MGSLLGNSNEPIKGKLFIPGVEVFFNSLWLLWGQLSAQIRRFHLNYMCVHTPKKQNKTKKQNNNNFRNTGKPCLVLELPEAIEVINFGGEPTTANLLNYYHP